jgi:hypothetical protein
MDQVSPLLRRPLWRYNYWAILEGSEVLMSS